MALDGQLQVGRRPCRCRHPPPGADRRRHRTPRCRCGWRRHRARSRPVPSPRAAGRSTTSPAAMRLTVPSERRRIFMAPTLPLREGVLGEVRIRLPKLRVRRPPSSGGSSPFARYCRARTLPSSTPGWSNGSTPISLPMRMVSSMKCIISAPMWNSSILGRWICAHRAAVLEQGLGGGARFGIDQIAQLLARRDSPAPAPWRAARGAARPLPLVSTVIRVNSALPGPSRNSCNWLCWSTGPSTDTGVEPLPSLPRLSAQSCRHQPPNTAKPVGIGPQDGGGQLALLGQRMMQRRAARRRRIGRRIGVQHLRPARPARRRAAP